MDAQSVRSDIPLQRRLLQMLASHVWLAAMPSVYDIADPLVISDAIIHFQFKSLVEKLQTFQQELNKAATPPGNLYSMYSEVFDLAFWKNHPLRCIANYRYLQSKMAQDLTGSAIEALQDLLLRIDATIHKPTISVHGISTWLDDVKNQYDLIVMKNVQITWSANNQIQNKIYDLLSVLCRKAKEGTDNRLINGVEKLSQFFYASRQHGSERPPFIRGISLHDRLRSEQVSSECSFPKATLRYRRH
jgi:hypothetical protein